MQERANRGRWPVSTMLVLGLAALLSSASFLWVRSRRPTNSLSSGLDAYARGDWVTASDWARERLKQASDDREALRLLARSSIRLGRDSSALSLYERLGPSSMLIDDLYLLGTALARAGNTKGSVEVWEQVLKADPDHPETLHEMIKMHLQASRFHAAAAAADRLARHPDWRNRADALMGRIELNRDNPAKAAQLWQQVLTHEPAVPGNASVPLVSRKDLARALLRTRRSAEARTQLETILATEPDAEASWLMSRAFLQEGALPAAVAAYKEAGSFAEENPTVPDPSPFAGAESCAPCHSEKYQAQQSSRHAKTFHHISERPVLELPVASLPDPADSKVTHTFRRVGDHFEQDTRTTLHVYNAVLDYAFGSGDRGKTMVGHDSTGRNFELRLSLYHKRNAQAVWDVTSGHAPHPASDQDFLGLPLSHDAVRRCLSCHVTSPQALLEGRAPENADQAIGCEKCHGPGANHLLAVTAKFPDLAIARPSLVSGARVVKICAQCHSPPGKAVEPDDPTAVRFQGTTLTWSRCYTESKDRLDCVSCHDPHRNVATEAAHYEAKCLVCHPGGEPSNEARSKNQLRRFDLSEAPRAPSCPVNPARGCISCHMPKVKDVVPHSSFTDHFIRIHRENSTVNSK